MSLDANIKNGLHTKYFRNSHIISGYTIHVNKFFYSRKFKYVIHETNDKFVIEEYLKILDKAYVMVC